MFGWRKRPDGFEWHKYVRTTIKIRREHRRQRIEDVRHAAAEQVGAAGAAIAAGSRAAGAAARDGVRVGIGAAGNAAQGAGGAFLTYGWLALRKTGVAMSALANTLAAKASIALRPLTDILARTNIGGPIALAGAIALGSGIGRYRSIGADGETLITLGIGLLLAIAALPMLSRMTGIGMPRLGAIGIPPRVAVGALAVVLVGGIAWFVGRGAGEFASLGRFSLFAGTEPIEGRAQAIAGDTLRIGKNTVRLSGIEAPESEQRCGKGNRQWRCGAEAQAALSRIVGSRKVTCSPDGTDSSGRTLGRCEVAGTDIAGEMVKRGHVFAESGFFTRYSSEQEEAKTAKAGLWSGDAERPSDYRAKAWEDAKRKAPDGCPIKGLVRDGDRVYVLPHAPEYERGRVQTSKGGRWFCSERDAVSAGFKAVRS